MKTSLTLPVLSFLAFSCTFSTTTNTSTVADHTLPDNRPVDFELHSDYDGGMQQHRTNIYISRDSCYYKDVTGDTTMIDHFVLTDTELDALYAVLKANKFDQIESTTDSTTMDRGGFSVNVFWNKSQSNYSVSDAQRSFVRDEWFKQWGTVLRYVDSVATSKSESANR